MTIKELLMSAKTDSERKKILLAYYKGFNEGIRISLNLLTEGDTKDADGDNKT